MLYASKGTRFSATSRRETEESNFHLIFFQFLRSRVHFVRAENPKLPITFYSLLVLLEYNEKESDYCGFDCCSNDFCYWVYSTKRNSISARTRRGTAHS